MSHEGKAFGGRDLVVAQCSGAFRIVAGGDTDITPNSALRQALLAVLLTSPGQVRSRTSLYAMFWAGSVTKNAAQNLRRAIYLLRQDLAPLGSSVIGGDLQAVWLKPGVLMPDRTSGPRFLDGLDVNVAGAEGFEEWLQFKRQAGSVSTLPSSLRVSSPSQTPVLALLRTQEVALIEEDRVTVDHFADCIVRHLKRFADLPIQDMRDDSAEQRHFDIDQGTGPTHSLQAVAMKRGTEMSVHFRLRNATDGRILWMSEATDAVAKDAEVSSTALAEILLDRLVRDVTGEAASDLFPWVAITGLFSLDGDLVQRTESALDRFAEDRNRPVLSCVRLLAKVFRANEGVGPVEPLDPVEVCELVGTVPETDPMLPLALSMGGYSIHMLSGQNELAEAMIARAAALAPNLALNLDHLSVIRLMQGDIDGAATAQQRCLRTGHASPWRYTYDVSGAMIALAQGDSRSALLHANQALMRKPKFIGALRYAMLGFVLAGNGRDAERMQARIRQIRPDYDFAAWSEDMARRTPPALRDRFTIGAQAAGLY